MIHALTKGKAGRVGDIALSESWRDRFRKSEDLLTSMFWSRISYLPEEQFNRFMSQLLSEEFNHGPLRNVKFWERYSYVTYFLDKKVEPDVVLDFDDQDIIVEVKPPFGKGQYKAQWQQQVESYLQQDTHKKLIFIALGNFPTETFRWLAEFRGRYPDVRFHAISWGEVMHALSHSLGRNNRLASDCISLLSFYGIRLPTKTWSSLHNVISHPLTDNGFASK
ncbi:MAG: hypothetical protein ACRDD5_20400 [Silvania sp.]|uniref:hypothetical protein n=1 Tax=Silvania sp. TaxID=3016633 RepID=UPI003EE73231